MDEKPLRLRIIWPQAVPTDFEGNATEFGLQQGRGAVLPGQLRPDGATQHETAVTAYVDAKGRLRFRGACVQGKPEEPFLYLSWRLVGASSWVMRAKALLTPLRKDYVASLPDNSVLETTVSQMGHRPAGHVQEWEQV